MPKGSQNPLNRTKSLLLQSACFPSCSPFSFPISVFSYCRTGHSFLPNGLRTSFLSMGRKAVSWIHRASQCYWCSDNTDNAGTELWDTWGQSPCHRLSISMMLLSVKNNHTCFLCTCCQ